MLCKYCETKMGSSAKFCPQCGHIRPNKAPIRGRFWLITVVNCVLILAAFALFIALVTKDPSEAIEGQLEDLRVNKLTAAYYEYTSKSFQDAVSLGHFREFVEKNPSFLKVESIQVLRKEIENNISSLDVLLIATEGQRLPVKYRLIKEGDQWKILSIKFEEASSPKIPSNTTARLETPKFIVASEAIDKKVINSPLKKEPFDTKPLLKTIQGQLEQLRKKNNEKAYEDYTTTSFRKVTSLEDFNNFVNVHEWLLNDTTLDLGHLAIDNNIVSLSGTINTAQESYPVEYDLVEEEGAWKISHIEFFADKKQVQENVKNNVPMVFSKFAIGTDTDSGGLVTNPSLVFQPNSGKIHLNIYMDHALSGTSIKVHFQHADSGSNAPPLTATVPDDGQIILSFAFSPPSEGWPKGNYHIQAESSTNVVGKIDFKVE